MGCEAAPAVRSHPRGCAGWRPCGPRRELTPPHYRPTPSSVASGASHDGLRSGPGDPEPFTVVRRLATLRAASGLAPLTTPVAVIRVARGRKLPMGCEAAPAVLSRARWRGIWRPCGPRRELTPPRDRPALSPVASGASHDGLRSGPGDPEPFTVVRRLATLRAASGLAPLTTSVAVIRVARGRKLPMGCAAAPAVLSRARWCAGWRPCGPYRGLRPSLHRLR